MSKTNRGAISLRAHRYSRHLSLAIVAEDTGIPAHRLIALERAEALPTEQEREAVASWSGYEVPCAAWDIAHAYDAPPSRHEGVS